MPLKITLDAYLTTEKMPETGLSIDTRQRKADIVTILQFLQEFWLPISVVCAIPIVIACSIWQQLSECRGQLHDEFQNVENSLYNRLIK